MGHVIELSDKAFGNLKKNAKEAGVTPEKWIEDALDPEPNVQDLTRVSAAEKKKLHDFDKRMKQKLGEMWKKKIRKELADCNERCVD